MAAQPAKKKRSAAQVKAGQAYARAGRAAQASARAAAIRKTGKPPPRTKAQKAASLKFAAAGRSAQAARRAGKIPVTAKKAAASLDLQVPALSLHLLPVCAATAVAEHLLAATGVLALDEEIARLADQAGPVTIGDLLELVRADGFCGRRLRSFRRCEEGLTVPGLICGLAAETGYHAVLASPSGYMLSWGLLLPWPRHPAEAWHLEWDDEGHG